MAAASGGSSSISKTPNNIQWNIQNKSTKVIGTILLALAIIAAVGAIGAFAMHGGIASIGSDVMMFGGGAAGLAGLAYFGLKIRDAVEKHHSKKAWEKVKKVELENYAGKVAAHQNGDVVSHKVTLENGNTYFLVGTKGENTPLKMQSRAPQ